MGSSPKEITSKSGYTPSAAEQPLIDAAMQQAYALGTNPYDMYPDQTFVGASQPTQLGMAGMAGAAGQMAGMTSPFQQSWERGLNASNVAENPYVLGQLGVNQQQLNQNLQRNLLPSIQQGAVQGGGMNSARQGIAEGVALGDTQQGLANANAQTMLGAYGQGLSHENNMMNQAGSLRDAYAAPWTTLGGIGQTMEGYQGKALQDAMNRYYYPQQEAERRLGMMNQNIGQYQYGNKYNVQPNPNYQSPFSQALGIAAGIGGTMLGMPGAGGMGTVGQGIMAGMMPNTFGYDPSYGSK